MHQRLQPRTHRFEYGLFMLAIDLDELPKLDRALRWFSHNRRNLYEFRDRDHLEFPSPGRSPGLKSSLIAWLASQGIAVAEDARITLVTLPRVAGYIFNPVSFYFVETPAGRPVCAVAEVGNTFGELKPYVIPHVENGSKAHSTQSPVVRPETPRYQRIVPKHYYVSPFSDLEVRFDFRLRAPDDRLEMVINDVSPSGQTLLISTLVGERRPLTDRQLIRLTAQYPLVTLRVIALIHWQALKLWAKRLPWQRKRAHPELQRDVFRPHGATFGAPRPRTQVDLTAGAAPQPRLPFGPPLDNPAPAKAIHNA